MSNLGGPFGIKQFCAIINPPQSGILAVGSGKLGTFVMPLRNEVMNPSLSSLSTNHFCDLFLE